ncbi:MAG: hypothetical protein WBW48_12745 [Anaerolineae bacterium]
MVDWLFSEAGAGWIFGVVSLVALIITHLRKARPSRLVFHETRNIEPVKIRESMRDRINIQFDGELVENLSQVEADLMNSGGAVIESPEITVTFPSEVRILDALLVDKPTGGSVAFEENKASIRLPFLNPHREYQHVERVSFTLSGKADRLLVEGMAPGWSVRHLRIPTEKERTRTAMRWLVGFGAAMLLFVVYGFLVDRWFGIPMSEVSLRAFIYYLPAILAWVLFFVLGARSINRRIAHS